LTLKISLVGFGGIGYRKFIPALLSVAEQSALKDYSLIRKGEKIELSIIDVYFHQTKLEELKQEIEKKNINLEVKFILRKQGNSIKTLQSQIDTKKFDLVYIASPNATHVEYIDFFLLNAHQIYVEKPIVNHLSELEKIEKNHLPDTLMAIQLFDHYLMKPSLNEFINNYTRYQRLIGEIQQINFFLIESNKIKEERSWLHETGMIRDLAVHYLSILFKLNEKGLEISSPANIKVLDVCKARYTEERVDIVDPKETAAHLKLKIHDLDSTCIVGKGAGFTRKELLIKGTLGTLVIDTVKGIIYLNQSKKSEILFSREVGFQKFIEHWNFLNGIFNSEKNLGLSYSLAKAQINLLEKTDQFMIKTYYKAGEFPFNSTL